MGDQRTLVSLTELSALPGMPCQTTLRKLIRDNRDFPVAAWGQHGIAHEIDLDAALKWFAEREQQRIKAERERMGQVSQYAFELLGDSALGRTSAFRGTTAERRIEAEIELLAIKIAERRSQLIWRASVQEAAAAVLEITTAHSATVKGALAEIGLSPAQLTLVTELLEADLTAFAVELAKIGNSDE